MKLWPLLASEKAEKVTLRARPRQISFHVSGELCHATSEQKH